uniref:DUF7745 domain-containing protein n=1 Tax=Lupinus angustifolius TaxID=3871 RepID=A0A182BFE5_LUPAN|nr:hypothetical protein [Lupinus angustifolius]
MEIMIQYWNPELRVFEFPEFDASPTVEEYEMLLGIPVLDRSKVYLFTRDHKLTEGYIEEMIGARLGIQNIIKQEKFEGLKWTYLKKHILKMEEQKNWKAFGSSFALAVYGLVLFPFVADMINQEALDVFYKVKRFSVNPVPAVLAETLLQFYKALVLGQLKWGMSPVTSQQLNGFVFLYKDKNTSNEVLNEVRRALHNIRFYGKNELGEHQAFYT